EMLWERVKEADSNYPQVAAKLSNILLGPITNQLGNKRLLIVGDGLLQYIPFAALPIPAVSNPDSKFKSQGLPVPLIVENEIVSLPSASTLVMQRRELAEHESAPKTIAIFANPVGGLVPLPKTEWTAKKILALVKPKMGKLFTRFDANLTTATSPELYQYRIIDFMTHGFLDSDFKQSGIVLSLVDREGRKQDGLLNAAAIFNLKLRADLVVLAACQSGLDLDPDPLKESENYDQRIKRVKDQGLSVLARGFIYAGAKRVKVSLWNIQEDATVELLYRFYKAMLGPENLPPAAALRSAQIQMLKLGKWSNPYYWAAFVISGEYNGDNITSR
ncbi:MAG: CHAT domain-containing protein, partial [Acidobacteriota bacterium]